MSSKEIGCRTANYTATWRPIISVPAHATVFGKGGEPMMMISRFSPLLVILTFDGALEAKDLMKANANTDYHSKGLLREMISVILHPVGCREG